LIYNWIFCHWCSAEIYTSCWTHKLKEFDFIKFSWVVSCAHGDSFVCWWLMHSKSQGV
jgi:hypothetical protein